MLEDLPTTAALWRDDLGPYTKAMFYLSYCVESLSIEESHMHHIGSIALLLAIPSSAQAGFFRKNVPNKAADAPTLESLLESDGWTAAGATDGRYEIGTVFKPNASDTIVLVADSKDCFNTEAAKEYPLAKQAFTDQLSAGLDASFLVGGVEASAGRSAHVSFEQPVHTVISAMKLLASKKCKEWIQEEIKSGTSFANGFVISETLSARLSKKSCQKYSGRANAMGVGSGSALLENCREQEAAGKGSVIGYKVTLLSEVSGLREILEGVPIISEVQDEPSPVDVGGGPVPPPAPLDFIAEEPQPIPGVDDPGQVLEGPGDRLQIAVVEQPPPKVVAPPPTDSNIAALAARASSKKANEEQQFNALADQLKADAAKDYAELKPLFGMVDDPEIQGLLALFVTKYTDAKVEVGDREQKVVIEGLAEVRALLPRPKSTNSIGMEFVTISPGSFEMGCTAEEWNCGDSSKPAHTVTLSRGFQIQTTEVTQGQYRAVMDTNPSKFSSCGSDCPVEGVSWFDAIKFANALSKKEGLRPAYSGTGDSIRWNQSANGYRLPTEAEWEYAARAGKATRYSGSNEANDVAWTSANAGGGTQKVGTKQPNAWGLHDMSGNVREWCWDRYGHSYYRSSPGADPVGATYDNPQRVTRGGSWRFDPPGARVAARGLSTPAYRFSTYGYSGLRLLRTSP
jgi:formylglycine-generating enzyme required for sulfatase activity